MKAHRKQSHLDHWPPAKKLSVIFNRNLRKAHRLFRTFPVAKYDSIMDIGAHRGEFALRAGAYFEPSRTWLVEADPAMVEILRRDFPANPGWTVIHSAVSDVSGQVELRVNEHRESSSILPIEEISARTFGKEMKEVNRLTVPSLSLDDLFDQYDIPGVDLMKVDIQGAEKLLIVGGPRALDKTHAIYLEVNFERFYSGAPLFAEIDGLLRDSGFRLRSFHENRLGADGALAYANALYIKPAFQTGPHSR